MADSLLQRVSCGFDRYAIKLSRPMQIITFLPCDHLANIQDLNGCTINRRLLIYFSSSFTSIIIYYPTVYV